ncbi:MAG: acyltransferase [Bacteroidetes bacterium]|nr:acyltransferase [Bacteroidota bacterium]
MLAGLKPMSRDNRIPALDGLRGLAILAVIQWHYLSSIENRFPGWIGVDIFFCLSGYLITDRLLSSSKTPGHIWKFYLNRALRLLPSYFLTLLVFFTIVHFLVRTSHQPLYSYYYTHLSAFLTMTQNWTFVMHNIPSNLSLVPLWSVAVETQAYLLWPILLLFLKPGRKALRIAGLLILTIMVCRSLYSVAFPYSAWSIYYNTLFRLDSLLMGMALCLMGRSGIPISRTTTAVLLPLALMGTIYVGCATGPFHPYFTTIGYTVNALLSALILSEALRPAGLIARLLANRMLQFLGRISYTLYLVHVPILLLTEPALNVRIQNWLPNSPADQPIAVSMCFGICLLYSSISYKYFETPILSLKTRQTSPQTHQ